MGGRAAVPASLYRHAARLLLVWALCWTGYAHAAIELAGAWRDVREGDTPEQVLADFRAGTLTPFDPAKLCRFPKGEHGTWVVIAQRPPWVEEQRVLSIYPAPMGEVTFYGQNRPSVSLAMDDFGARLHGHGRLAFAIDQELPASTPLLLRFPPSTHIAAPVSFHLQGWNAFLANDADWLTFATASFAVMLAMALMALCFAQMLRDVTFAWYAGYILCYAVIQALQTGYVYHPLDLQALAGLTSTLGSAAVALSVAFASMFMTRFCELQKYAPLLRIPVLSLAVGMVQIVILRCSHIPVLENVGQLLVNPLLMLGALLLLVAAVIAALRGSRHAWFFLAGWTPLLVLTAMASAQVNGALSGLRWLNDAGLVAGAFEAIVLSFGLADRALMLRHDRDHVRQLADRDSLTLLLNRRAWDEAAMAAMDSPSPQPLALLFMDLDHFKILNDRQGHAKGDQALVAVAQAISQELRPSDLLGRYGGEEFIALLDGADEQQAMQVATRLCRRVHRLEIPIDDNRRVLSISVGVAVRHPSDTLQSLIERADKAMYDAKMGGRNRVHPQPPDDTGGKSRLNRTGRTANGRS
jgi:diguanylate cyclase (GGDEF)-like protein